MNKAVTILSVALGAQVILAGSLFYSGQNSFETQAPVSLLSLEQHAITEITLQEGDNDKPLTLVKNGESWHLAEYPNLPLLDYKVSALTDTLINSKVNWPVSSSQASHERFKVADDNFEKRITYKLGDDEVDILLGESPSFKKLYARNGDNNDVFTIEFSGYQLSVDKNDWLNKSLLSVKDISEISQAGLAFEKAQVKQDADLDERTESVKNTSADKSAVLPDIIKANASSKTRVETIWQVKAPAKLPEGQTLDTERIDELLEQFSSLTVTAIAEQEIAFSEIEKLSVKDADGKQFDFEFAEHEDSYYVKRSDFAPWFSLGKAQFDNLANIKANDFFITPDDDENSQQLSNETNQQTDTETSD
ncbi:DUF4340 domain-containing protein [Pseudoalteromonas phenolica]|uniref:Parallel beta-helix repeat-containing protein n=1 Tax=Pseudoalteromonas phenolica TaxID=161398 RepID=A0A0S2K3H4_9GAMM|nr:DUF4340 domain-containing protein [Pseudoalteromonas phenolica]ALO42664.1 Parallel beta-helix repeat-containing protein [Pseudoalteromonas phenolica]MBE0356230.1 hypothetical protein [Pseudoalteromonas phenolica O-BC30]RXE91469.1 DUF4340 domain-containing protein [Pseudoalteromonas phenolica O-BC30]